VHATEFDRTGGNGVNQVVYNLERQGMHLADSIIAVSNFTKNKIVEHYGINPDKVQVVYNAIEFNGNHFSHEHFGIKKGNKVVLFMGRITLQKGPDYFLYAAKRVLEVDPNVRFIIAGSGDMATRMIEKAAELGIADKVLFAGFLRGPDIDKAYQMADLFVMPSVSEPFGLTPLEAMRNKTPVLISKQSGVSEVINNCLKVDFWDIDKMANQIIGTLKYQEAHDSLRENGFCEVQKFNWDEPARKCIDIYRKVLGGT
jgi:glycosyltransferase involved in cell wall biosynthesis